MSAEHDIELERALEVFIKGTKIVHLGYFMDSKKLRFEGLDLLSDAMKVIDEKSVSGRNIFDRLPGS